MSLEFHVGDRVSVLLDSKFWSNEGWFKGTIVRIDPYSEHRQFYWVELDVDVQARSGVKTHLVSVLNPSHIRAI